MNLQKLSSVNETDNLMRVIRQFSTDDSTSTKVCQLIDDLDVSSSEFALQITTLQKARLLRIGSYKALVHFIRDVEKLHKLGLTEISPNLEDFKSRVKTERKVKEYVAKFKFLGVQINLIAPSEVVNSGSYKSEWSSSVEKENDFLETVEFLSSPKSLEELTEFVKGLKNSNYVSWQVKYLADGSYNKYGLVLALDGESYHVTK